MQAICLIGLQRAGLGPPCRPTFWCQKVGKEPAPATHVPPLRCGQPAPSSSWSCAAQLTACLRHSVQTNGRKSEHEAAALCGAAAIPKNLPSQAWAQGAKDRIRDSFFIKINSCYRNPDKRWMPITSRIMQAVRTRTHPCGRACGTLFRLRALEPQSANASCSDLPPCV